MSMALNFSNPSRSYDENHHRVRFWGYDSAMEVDFFVVVDALKKLCPKLDETEDGYLQAFDNSIKKIHSAAENIHKQNNKGSFSYILTENEF